jgi:hypothetical protein
MWAVHKRLTAILLSLVVGLTTCNRGQNHVAPKSELNAAEYEAFSAYVAGKFTAKKQAGQDTPKILIILDTTASGDDDLMPDENGPNGRVLAQEVPLSPKTDHRCVSKSERAASIPSSFVSPSG